MEFTNEFRIPLDVDRALAVLVDLERVAPCFPGATLESVDGDTYSGRVKVKVGPMSLTYSGDATVSEVDEEAHTARIEASGREKRGGGTASADVASQLRQDGDHTVVTVTTDLKVTGRPAQFGRGVMADVGAKIIDRFAENLRAQLEEEGDGVADGDAEATSDHDADARSGADADAGSDEGAAARSTSADGTGEAGASGGADRGDGTPVAEESGPRRIREVAPRDEALDLVDVAGEATLKRLAPVLVAAAVLLVLWWVLRDRDED